MSNVQMVLVAGLAEFMASLAVGAAPASGTQEQLAPYSTPQRAVHVGKGRTINLVCLGQGSPTVVLSAGLDAWSVWWFAIQPALAKETRVCSWDRAGYGFSSPSAEPQDTTHTTKDLEQALNVAGIAGPYVMVGHSMGAYETLRFTDLHRSDVVGMVLVDPAIPDTFAVAERIAPLFARMSHALNERHVKQLQDCAAALRPGTLKRTDPQYEQCTGTPVPLDPQLKAAITRLNADPARLLTQASTEKEFDTKDSREVVNAKRDYGDMPLIVLTAGRYESSALSALSAVPPGTPGASTPGELAELRKQISRFVREAWGPAHDAYAALSTRGSNRVVDSGHNIPINEPDAVISAVTEVLSQIQVVRPNGVETNP